MFYLYYTLPDRRLVKCNDKQGCHLAFANQHLANNHAGHWSLYGAGYPVTIDRSCTLHNTRDNRPCDNEDFPSNPRLYLGA